MAQRQSSSPTSFNSSPLVRLLASLDIAPVSDSAQTFAEKLSHWVAWTDAISLSRVLADGRDGLAHHTRSHASVPAPAVLERVRRVRAELAQSITKDTTLRGDTLKRVHLGHGVPAGDRTDYAAYRRSVRAHQHTMEDRIAELRVEVRAAVVQLNPALGHLAALDAVLDDALSAHQRRLLENVPVLLEKRFQALHKLLQESSAHELGPDTPAPGRQPAAIGHTLQQVLLAELEVRLQPVEGMMDALGLNPMEHA